MANPLLQPPKGFRDLMPSQMAIRNWVISTFTDVFLEYGFQPLQTPTLEYADLLLGKYGEEADKLVYTFEDRGGRRLGLNYDLTVPTARILSQYPDLPKPFKRYQIQPAYRAENPQKGRYRQFTQCDIDIFGSSSPLSDAEILSVINTSLTRLGFTNFSILYNSRPLLYALMEKIGLDRNLWTPLLQVIDKADKRTPEELDQELSAKSIPVSYTKQILPLLNESLDRFKIENSTLDAYLDQVITAAISQGVPASNLVFTPTLVRGLDYYTGPIFETVVKEPKIGSVTGGGRYDNLIKLLGGPAIPAVGTTLGLDRICDVIEELGLFTPPSSKSPQILVSIFSIETLSASLNLVKLLRQAKIPTEIYSGNSDRLDKQLKYANSKSIPFVAILGEAEINSNSVALKNLSTGEQKLFSLKDITKIAEYVCPTPLIPS